MGHRFAIVNAMVARGALFSNPVACLAHTPCSAYTAGMDASFIFVIVALILSIVLHETAHGYVANWLGDPTARLSGRLTLNPLPHIDLVGSVIVPGLLYLTNAGIFFGWAKPVPYNPYNLRNQKWGEALVAAAGPATNLLIALIFGFLMRFAAASLGAPALAVAAYVVYINILLAFFNLIPLPPLDGSKVLAAFLPPRAQMRLQELAMRVQQFGLIATFLFIFLFANIFWQPFSVLVRAVFSLITGAAL